MLIAGIDEAGRGPCLGPLVLAIAMVEKSDEEKLTSLGVKDSKQLSAQERERQFPRIKRITRESHCIHISPQEIDELMTRRSLNEIEAMYAARLIDMLGEKPEVIFVDSPDVVMSEFAKRIKKYTSCASRIVSEHKADQNYPVVSAASVIAKVERDGVIKKIAQEYGELGSGYPGDEATIMFLKKYLLQHSVLPPFVRKSWQTIGALESERFQKKLF